MGGGIMPTYTPDWHDLQVNYLDSQANVYASFGVGGRYDTGEYDAFAGYGALEADYETRRIYTLVSAETLQSPSDVDYSRLRGRVGVAPYKAPIYELHTWVIVQTESPMQRSKGEPIGQGHFDALRDSYLESFNISHGITRSLTTRAPSRGQTLRNFRTR